MGAIEVSSKRVGRPSPEMRLHQIVSFAQSKMDAVFRFYLPWRKAKSPLSHLLESFCCWKLGKSPSCDEEP